jgi:hypothetical protein
MKLRKRVSRVRRSYQFFREHAGYVVGQRALCALSLAKAEHWADVAGIEFVTMPDWDADASFVDTWSEREQEEWRKHDHECVSVLAFVPCPEHGTDCKHARCVASLGGIFDADNNYLRVIRAELASEALQTLRQERAR